MNYYLWLIDRSYEASLADAMQEACLFSISIKDCSLFN